MIYSAPCEYAFRALTWLAMKGYGRAKEIATEDGMPAFFLAKILKKLAAEKILISTRGRKGGFQLAYPAEQISLEMIVDKLEGLDDLDRCAVGWADCSDEKPCSLHYRFKPVRNEIKEYLKTTTIANLVEAEEAKKQSVDTSPAEKPQKETE